MLYNVVLNKGDAMKRITKNIKRGICLYLSENNMTHEKLATEIHATRQAVSQWLSGETKAINDRIWPRLEPLISKYINELALDNDGIQEYYKILD